MTERWNLRARELLADVGRAALVVGLLWMGVDTASAQTPAAAPAPSAAAMTHAAALYTEHCAACHGVQRTGGMGPALLPESLSRLRPAESLQVIAQGRVATQMPRERRCTALGGMSITPTALAIEPRRAGKRAACGASACGCK